MLRLASSPGGSIVPDEIIDSKYRVLEKPPRAPGRQRCLVSDLISGRMAVLEKVTLEGFERLQRRWSTYWQAILRERASRFARLSSFVPVTAVGAWESGPYYVFECDDEGALQGRSLSRFPAPEQLRALLKDIQSANAAGDHVLNLRPESLCLQDEVLRVLPSAYILPHEMLARAGARSPYQPPELRHAGHLGPTTDGFIAAGVLQACMGLPGARPETWQHLQGLLALEPWRRPRLEAVQALLDGGSTEAAVTPEGPPRRSVDRLADLDLAALPAASLWRPLLESLDAGLAHMSEGTSVVLFLEAPASGPGLREVFAFLRESLALLRERPHVVRLEALTAWEPRDLTGHGPAVVLVPEYRPAETELLPLHALLAQEKMRPVVWVVGARRSAAFPAEGESAESLAAWLRERCHPEVHFLSQALECPPEEMPAAPVSPASRHLLDLLSVLDADATGEMLRLALPQQEVELPEALAELEGLGHLRRSLEAGGWWGQEQQLVVRLLRPEALELRRNGLTSHRQEELHLLLSHLLAESGTPTLGQRLMRFDHLFAGGSWEVAAAESGPLLQAVQRRGLVTLLRQLQRKLVNSNLVQHLKAPQLLEVLHSLGQWEVERQHASEGRGYYERAAEKLFALSEEEVAALDLHATSDMLLAHAELLERHSDYQRSLDLLQRFLERYGEGIPTVDRGRLFTAMGYCEFRLTRYGAAEERCQLALNLLDARRHPEEVAQLHNVLGLVRWRTSRYDEAQQYLSSSLTLREKSGNRLLVARAYNNLGLLARARRRFSEALEYHRKSMEIRQELGDQAGVAKGLVNLAYVHREMKDLGRAEDLARRACALSEQLGSRSSLATAKGLQGEVFLAQGRRAEARAALEEAVRLAQQVGDVAELFMALRKQAHLELLENNLQRAEELLQESEQSMSQAGSPLEEANWHHTQGQLRRAQGDRRGAAFSFEHAGNNLARLGDTSQAAEAFQEAAQLYHESGAAARARELVVRTRQLLEREGAVVPKTLLDLETLVGEGEVQPSGPAEALPGAAALQRACEAAASLENTAQAMERILGEARRCAGAQCALLVEADGDVHRASSFARELEQQAMQPADWVRARPRLLARAQQTLLPLSSDDLQDEESAAPFYLVPVEARERRLGSVWLEWSEGARLPGEEVRRAVRSMVHLLAILMEREAILPAAAARVEATPAGARRGGTTLDDIVGKSGKRQEMIDFIRKVRDLDETVLLLGENGTGKDVMARAIHDTSKRRAQPFVTMNCGAVPAGMWERELFGHDRGAFTDATETKPGYFESAHRGTLFLDEIGDMPWEMQARFLRVLEDKAVQRLGVSERIRVDVRVIAATNTDLEGAMRAGRFREDLFHRLNVLAKTLPPLRDRREDVEVLALHFLDEQARGQQRLAKRLSGEAQRVLMQYPWPGNVRELQNAMKRCDALSRGEVIVPEDLPTQIVKGADGTEIAGPLDIETVARWVLDHASYSEDNPLLDRLEREIARQLVEKVKVVAKAGRYLGLSRPTLYAKLRR